MNRTKQLLAFAVVAALALVAAACGGDDTATPGADAAHNQADIEFARGMIPHHQQAVEMSEMVIERGGDPEVVALATQIRDAQAPEIELMRGWLEDWGADQPDDGHQAHGGMGMDDMGMMSDADMDRLHDASGPAMDTMFLEMMIRHHQGAITMAETELRDGEYPDALDLARTIIRTQQAEIDQMRSMLAAG